MFWAFGCVLSNSSALELVSPFLPSLPLRFWILYCFLQFIRLKFVPTNPETPRIGYNNNSRPYWCFMLLNVITFYERVCLLKRFLIMLPCVSEFLSAAVSSLLMSSILLFLDLSMPVSNIELLMCSHVQKASYRTLHLMT